MKQTTIYLAWLVSLIATAGSLYFSNVLMFPPCSLCWWQRIFMYPLLVLFTVAFIKRDQNCLAYASPLIVFGLGTSIYHNLLYYGFIEKSIVPCTAGASCTSIQIEWLGFITIPLMALTAFSILFFLISFSFTQIIFRRIFHE